MAILNDRDALVSPASGDLLFITDVSDTTDAATGTDKKITYANLTASLQSKITISDTAPDDPSVNDLWIDIS